MSVLPRRALLAIAAVVEVALQGHERPIAAKSLASRHGLPPRHLEPVLQALVREGILKGVRGPHGGYELARERKHITAEDILRGAAPPSAEKAGEPPLPESPLVNGVVRLALAEAERTFSAALSRINVEDMAK